VAVAVVTVCLVAALACVAYAGFAALRTIRPDRRAAVWLLGYAATLILIAGAVAVVHEKVSPAEPDLVASAAAASSSSAAPAPAATEEARDQTELAYPLDVAAVEDFEAGETLASGATAEPMCLANFHARAVALGAGRSYAWWTRCDSATDLKTVANVRKALALPPAWGARDEVAVACVPAGVALTYVRGQAATQGKAYPGGGLQLRVLNFDTDWIVAQQAIPPDGVLPVLHAC
jgi:hypothetical protein